MAFKNIFNRLFNNRENKFVNINETVEFIDKIDLEKEWLRQFEDKKKYLQSKINYWDQYEKVKKNRYENEDGDIIKVIDQGYIKLHNEYFLVCDPVTGISWDLPAYFKPASIGEFKVETLIIESPDKDCFSSNTRVKFSEGRPTEYIQALQGREKLDKIKSEYLFGFSSVSGFVGIMDIETKEKYINEISDFQTKHPDRNWYDDMFLEKLNKSKDMFPNCNKNKINFAFYELEDKNYSIPIISLPFNNIGSYPVFLGVDKGGNLLELIIHYMEVEI